MTFAEFADAVFLAYSALQKVNHKVTQKIDPIADLICSGSDTQWTRKQFGIGLEKIQTMCLRGELPYMMMLEVDMTWQEHAAFNRRKPENKVWVFDRPVYIIEMKRKPEDV